MCIFQYRSESGGLWNLQTNSQLFGIDPGHHNGAGPRGAGNAQFSKVSSIVFVPCCSIEITCLKVNFLTIHDANIANMCR